MHLHTYISSKYLTVCPKGPEHPKTRKSRQLVSHFAKNPPRNRSLSSCKSIALLQFFLEFWDQQLPGWEARDQWSRRLWRWRMVIVSLGPGVITQFLNEKNECLKERQTKHTLFLFRILDFGETPNSWTDSVQRQQHFGELGGSLKIRSFHNH